MLLRRNIRLVVWGAAALFLIALALRDLQLDRSLVLEARLDRATPYLSTFGPPARVIQEKRPQESFSVRIIGEPVYVNLRIPRWFRRATVELVYENTHSLPFKLGVRTHPTQWAFQFPESLPIGDFKFEISDSEKVEVKTLRVPFALQRAWQVERNVYRFVLSVPGVNPEQPIVIRGLRVTVERDPICFGQLCL